MPKISVTDQAVHIAGGNLRAQGIKITDQTLKADANRFVHSGVLEWLKGNASNYTGEYVLFEGGKGLIAHTPDHKKIMEVQKANPDAVLIDLRSQKRE